MLTALSLRDFVIVESLSLDVRRGFTVLTGETGAGKSILIDALQLILGGRADAASSVRVLSARTSWRSFSRLRAPENGLRPTSLKRATTC